LLKHKIYQHLKEYICIKYTENRIKISSKIRGIKKRKNKIMELEGWIGCRMGQSKKSAE